MVGIEVQIMRTSFKFTFFTTAEGVEKIFKTMFELLELWQLNKLLRDSLMNDRIIYLKVSILSEFLIFQSNIFDSIIVEGKKVFLKKSCFTFIAGTLLHCLALYEILCIGIIEKRYFGDCDFSILYNQQSFLYQRRC